MASKVFSESWRFSHKEIVTEEFLLTITPERQKDKLQQYIDEGFGCFVGFYDYKAVGVLILDYNSNELVSIYISPDLLYRGYGGKLMTFALYNLNNDYDICLSVLNVNWGARRFYEKNGFEFSGKSKILSVEKNLSEMVYIRKTKK